MLSGSGRRLFGVVLYFCGRAFLNGPHFLSTCGPETFPADGSLGEAGLGPDVGGVDPKYTRTLMSETKLGDSKNNQIAPDLACFMLSS